MCQSFFRVDLFLRTPSFRTSKGVRNRVLGQNGPFFKLNVENRHIFKLLFKMVSLMPRRCHIIKKIFFFIIIVKAAVGKRNFIFVLHFCTKTTVGKRDFIFVLKPQLTNATSFLY